MKKIIAILMILSVLALLVGCAKPKEAPAPTPEVETPVEAEVGTIEQDVSEIDALEAELDTSELDEIDAVLKDLEEFGFE